jgi:hypothetical protein
VITNQVDGRNTTPPSRKYCKLLLDTWFSSMQQQFDSATECQVENKSNFFLTKPSKVSIIYIYFEKKEKRENKALLLFRQCARNPQGL